MSSYIYTHINTWTTTSPFCACGGASSREPHASLGAAAGVREQRCICFRIRPVFVIVIIITIIIIIVITIITIIVIAIVTVVKVHLYAHSP